MLELTEEQQAAVESPYSETKVIAGAGAGKTRVLISRIQWMLANGYAPESIVVFTFTRKAAKEVKDRLGDTGKGVRVGTFHAIALDLISESRKVVPIDDVMADHMVQVIAKTSKKPVTRSMIDACRTARALGKAVANPDINRATDTYEGRLRYEQAIDYLGMLIQGIELAKTMESHHVLVEEAQDTDDVQWSFVDALKKTGTGFYVGDVRQTIYSWRGANPQSFMNRPGELFNLSKTFRFGAEIADVSNLVAANTGAHAAPVYSGKGESSEVYYSSFSEVSSLSEVSLRELLESHPHSDVAILCRYNSQVKEFTDYLRGAGIPVSTIEQPIDHSAVLAVMRYLSEPTAPIAHAAFLNHKVARKLLPTLASDELSTESCATIAQSWLDSLGDKVTPAMVLGTIKCPDSLRESFNWWSSEYSDVSIREAVRDFVTLEPELSRTAGVSVLTIHSAKGLEWPAVLVAMPPARKMSEEEWRVAYVALTRAQKVLVVSGVDNPCVDLVRSFTDTLSVA